MCFLAARSTRTGIITIHLLSKLAARAYKLAQLPQPGRRSPLQTPGTPSVTSAGEEDGGGRPSGSEGHTRQSADFNKLQSRAIQPQPGVSPWRGINPINRSVNQCGTALAGPCGPPDHEGGQLTGRTNRQMRQTNCSRFPPLGGNRCQMKK